MEGEGEKERGAWEEERSEGEQKRERTMERGRDGFQVIGTDS